MEKIRIRHTNKKYEKFLFWFYKNFVPSRCWKFEEDGAYMEGYKDADGSLHILIMEIK